MWWLRRRFRAKARRRAFDHWHRAEGFEPDPQYQSLCPRRGNESAFGRNERGHTRQHGRVLVARARISRTHAFSPGEPRPAIAAFAKEAGGARDIAQRIDPARL